MDLLSILNFVILIFSIVLHEIAHGWMAYKLGDPTAKNAGRLTLNPIPHIDLVGSILLPGILLLTNSRFLIGWAKPVPFNPGYFRNLRQGVMLVGAAGPATNLAIAVVAGMAWKLFEPEGTIGTLLAYASIINVVLAVFNLVPIPPLDGSRIVMGLLPPSLALPYARLERHGMLILFVLLWAGGMDYLVDPIAGFLLRIIFS